MTEQKEARLSWRRIPRSTGISGTIHNPTRGWELRRGEELIASLGMSADGYYWSAPSTNTRRWRNTAAEKLYFPDRESAKKHCVAWLRAQETAP
jgi:hypothetical protein